MKGYDTSNGYMGYVEGKYILFASEQRPVKKWMLSLIQKLKNLNMKHKNLRL